MDSSQSVPPDHIRIQSIRLLNIHLAAALDLRAQIVHARWNLRGLNVDAIDNMLETVAQEIDLHAYQIAEHAGSLGGAVQGTLQAAAERSYLRPYPLPGRADGYDHLLAVSRALEMFSQSVRDAIGQCKRQGDAATALCFKKIWRGVDHQLWCVDSEIHLYNPQTKSDSGPKAP